MCVAYNNKNLLLLSPIFQMKILCYPFFSLFFYIKEIRLRMKTLDNYHKYKVIFGIPFVINILSTYSNIKKII